jgi:hypothetical protein
MGALSHSQTCLGNPKALILNSRSCLENPHGCRSETRVTVSIFRLIFELLRRTVAESRMQTASVVVVFDETLDNLEQVF